MKRSYLRRTGKGLKRSPIERKPRRANDLDARAEWEAKHQVCAGCGFRLGQPGGWLETHHILDGKYGRPDKAWNWLRLCGRYNDQDDPPCHRLAEGEQVRRRDGTLWPKLSDGACLTLKRESDPESFDLEAMQEHMARLTRRKLPELEEVPVQILERRAVNARRK